jgi:hypothetical protein
MGNQFSAQEGELELTSSGCVVRHEVDYNCFNLLLQALRLWLLSVRGRRATARDKYVDPIRESESGHLLELFRITSPVDCNL